MKTAPYTEAMAKTKARPKGKSSTKKSEVDGAEARERNTADKVMQHVLEEHRVEASTERLDVWVTIECPHCGEHAELHVIQDMDGQSIDQDCSVCCRAFVAHVEIDDGEPHVGVEAS